MRAFICAVHFSCAQWMKKVDKKNQATSFKASTLLIMVLFIQVLFIILIYDYTLLTPMAKVFKGAPLVYGGIFYALTLGGLLLVLGDRQSYIRRVRSRMAKGSLNKYILGIKLNLLSCLLLFILNIIVNFR